MTQPTWNGRPLPPNDWEGDDFTPGAGGAYVTCQDTSAGRDLYYATNGVVDLDGREIRANIRPYDSNGVSLAQVSLAIARMTGPVRQLVWSTRTLPDIRAWLGHGLGLVIDGYYGAIPLAHREQRRADFNHAIFIPYRDGEQYLVYDPLNKDLGGYGKLHPAWAIEPFMRSLSGLTGWIDLEPGLPDAEGNPMTNLVPMTAHRVVDLVKGTVLYKTPDGDVFTTLSQAITLGVLGATSTHWHIADGDYGVYVPRDKVKAIRTQDINVGV